MLSKDIGCSPVGTDELCSNSIIRVNCAFWGDLTGHKLSILGKGRGTQKEEITITPSIAKALVAWREVSPASSIDRRMFVSLDRPKAGI